MSSKVRDAVRARVKARIAAMNQPQESVTKTKADLQGELDAAGVEYPKTARKAELEALLTPESVIAGEEQP